jgi:hypothetical protein
MPTDSVAPAGATQAAIELTPTATAINSVLQVDAAALWQVLPLTSVEEFSDGGYARLTLRELPIGSLLSVYREGPDGARTLVRGAAGMIDRQVLTSDLMVIEDHEAPIGVPVMYRIEIYDPVSGILAGTRSSSTVSLTLADVEESWLKDPGNPQRNLRVLVQKPPDWSRPIDQAAYVVKNRRNKVIHSGRRNGLEGDLAVWTRTEDELNALHLLADPGNVLLWQTAPGRGVGDLYINVGLLTEARSEQDAADPWRAWTLPLIQADMPIAVGINGPAGRTWQDVISEFATCADLLPVYATCEDLLLDRRTG